MRFHLAVVLSALLLLAATLCQAGETITIFGTNAKPPKTWSDNGVPKGILVDILFEISNRTGIDFDLKLFPWARALHNAKHGNGGIYGFSKTTERMKSFDYTDAMFYDDIILVTLKGKEFTFRSMEDLKGKTIGITRGAGYGHEFSVASQTIFTPHYDNGQKCRLLMLLAGRIDAAIIGPGKAGLDFLLQNDPTLKANAEKFVCLNPPIIRNPNYIGFIKDLHRGETIEQINEALHSMWTDGTIEAITEKYTSLQNATRDD